MEIFYCEKKYSGILGGAFRKPTVSHKIMKAQFASYTFILKKLFIDVMFDHNIYNRSHSQFNQKKIKLI